MASIPLSLQKRGSNPRQEILIMTNTKGTTSSSRSHHSLRLEGDLVLDSANVHLRFSSQEQVMVQSYSNLACLWEL